MSRYIDADAVIARIAGQMSYEIEVETGNETDCVDLAEELLNDIPSIDIVRCGECEYIRINEDGETRYFYCALEDRPNRQWSVDDTDFCSWGERKTDADG